MAPAAGVTKPLLDRSGGLPLDQRPWWPVAAVATAVWILLVQTVLWWIYYRPVPKALWGDELRYLEAASRLLAGDPGWWPEPLWPPLYHQFVAGLTWIGGGSLLWLQLAQSVLLAVIAVLLFDLTHRITGSRSAAWVAASWSLAYPSLVAFGHYLWPEVLHLFLFVALLWILATRWAEVWWCALAGIVLGLALLTKSLLLPFAPVLLLTATWGESLRRSSVRVAVVVVFAAVTVAPIIAANDVRLGSPTIANSAAFNLWVGLNDRGRENFGHDVVWPEYQRWEASAATHSGRQRVLKQKAKDYVVERGVLSVIRDQLSKQYFRLFETGCYLTDQLPGGYAFEQVGAGYLGASPGTGRIVGAVARVGYIVLLMLTPLGLLVCWGKSRWARALVLFVLYNLALFLWLHVKTRYRIQILPVAIIGIGGVVAWIEAGCRPRPSKAAVAGVLAVTALLLGFALG